MNSSLLAAALFSVVSIGLVGRCFHPQAFNKILYLIILIGAASGGLLSSPSAPEMVMAVSFFIFIIVFAKAFACPDSPTIQTALLLTASMQIIPTLIYLFLSGVFRTNMPPWMPWGIGAWLETMTTYSFFSKVWP